MSSDVKEKLVLVRMLSRGQPLVPKTPVDVSPSKLAQHLSPTLRDVLNLPLGHEAMRPSCFCPNEEEVENGKEEDATSIILKRLDLMEQAQAQDRKEHYEEVQTLRHAVQEHNEEVQTLQHAVQNLEKKVMDLESEQLLFFLRDVTDKWLFSFGEKRLVGCSPLTLDGLKKVIRDVIYFKEQVLIRGTKQNQMHIQLKVAEGKLITWRKAINNAKALGTFEVGEASGARQLEMLITSYMQVNQKARTSMGSLRWVELEAKIQERIAGGTLKIEGVNVGSLVKLMLGDLSKRRAQA